MKILKLLRWPAALALTASLTFYVGYYYATTHQIKINAAQQASHACWLIEKLTTGQTDEALHMETLLLNLTMRYIDADLSLDPPARIPFAMMRDGAMSSAQLLRTNYPDLAFDSPTVAQLEEYERHHARPH